MRASSLNGIILWADGLPTDTIDEIIIGVVVSLISAVLIGGTVKLFRSEWCNKKSAERRPQALPSPHFSVRRRDIEAEGDDIAAPYCS